MMMMTMMVMMMIMMMMMMTKPDTKCLSRFCEDPYFVGMCGAYGTWKRAMINRLFPTTCCKKLHEFFAELINFAAHAI